MPISRTKVCRLPLLLIAVLVANLLRVSFSLVVAEAFSHDGLGILAVKNVPGFADKRNKILPLAWRFGQLPEEVKAK